MNIYQKAKQNGCYLEATCVSTTIDRWEELMKGHTKANRIEAVKVALLAEAIDEEQARREIKEPWFNPYGHFKTKTHIIYIHSGIEHFIKIN